MGSEEVNILAGLSPETINLINATWPLLVMLLIFYFMIYRPQKKEEKQRAQMLSSLKKGDRVITVGGIHGTISAISENIVTLKVAEKVEIDFAKAAIKQVLNQGKKSNEAGKKGTETGKKGNDK